MQDDQARRLDGRLVRGRHPEVFNHRGDGMEMFRSGSRPPYTGSYHPQISNTQRRQIIQQYDLTPEELQHHQACAAVVSGRNVNLNALFSQGRVDDVDHWSSSYTKEFVHRHYDDLREFRSRIIAQNRHPTPPKITQMTNLQLRELSKAYILYSERRGHHRPQIRGGHHHSQEYDYDYDDNYASYPPRHRSPRGHRRPITFDDSTHHHGHDRHHSPRHHSFDGSPYPYQRHSHRNENYFVSDHSDDEGYATHRERRRSF